jgi:phosphonopyruvate decarboxylase
LIEPGQLSAVSQKSKVKSPLRITYLETLLGLLPRSAGLFATTGYTSRELWALQKEKPSHACFYSVGGMGFMSAIALGFARHQSQRLTCVLDGDGALLMHAGSLASIGASEPSQFLHILFRNDVHESTGGQSLAAKPESYAELAKKFGYKRAFVVESLEAFSDSLSTLLKESGPSFLEVRVASGTVDGLPRPEGTPKDWLATFQQQMT